MVRTPGSAHGMPRTGIESSCCQPRIDRTARCRLVGCWPGARSSSLRSRNCKPCLRGWRGLWFAPSLQKASARKSSVASAVPLKFIRPQLPAVLLNRDRASAYCLGLYYMKSGRGNPSRKCSGERQDTSAMADRKPLNSRISKRPLKVENLAGDADSDPSDPTLNLGLVS